MMFHEPSSPGERYLRAEHTNAFSECLARFSLVELPFLIKGNRACFTLGIPVVGATDAKLPICKFKDCTFFFVWLPSLLILQ